MSDNNGHRQIFVRWSFYDPDGHHWEVLWMDPAAAAPELPKENGGAR